MSLDIEIRTLGALIQIGKSNNHYAQTAMLELNSDYFYNVHTRCVFGIINKLFNSGELFDAISLSGLIPDNSYSFFQDSLRAEYYTSNLLLHDVEILASYATLRKQMNILRSTIKDASKETLPSHALELINNSLSEIAASNLKQKDTVRSYETIAEEFLSEQGEDDSYTHVDIPGMPPVPNNALIIIAGRSGHGKTFFAMHLMDKLIDAKQGKQCLYFNLEMAERTMLERHATLLGFTGETRKELIQNALPSLIEKNVSLISVPQITIEEIETQSRLAALREPLNVIVVDYLSLVTSKIKGEKNYMEQNNIAKRLAALSLELKCNVIGLIQVNRDFKTRVIADRIPQVADSAESMGSVHSATWWLGINQPQNDDYSSEFKDLFQIGCRKNRHGANFFLDLDFRNGQFFKRIKPFYETNPVSHGLYMRKIKF